MASFVRFHRAFTFSPPGARWGVVYPKGWTVLVPEAHAHAAEAGGAGRRVPRELVNRRDPLTRASLLTTPRADLEGDHHG